MHDGVRRLSVLVVVCCVALLVTYWLRGSPKGYGLFQLLRGQPAPSRSHEASARDGNGTNVLSPPEEAPMELEDVNVLAMLSRQKANLAATVVPSVVSIEKERPVELATVIPSPLFDGDIVMEPEWGTEPGQGSGVIISEAGHIVTNHHVVEGEGAITVTTADGRQFPAKLLGEDPVADIAVIQLDVEPDMRFPPLPLGDSDRVRQGDMVFSVGSPFGLDGTFTDGVISSAEPRRFSDSTPPLLQTNTILNRGNSGGPLINVRGKVIGINSGIYDGFDQVTGQGSAYGLAIPSNHVRAAVERITGQGGPSYGYLGVYLKDVYPHDAISLNLPTTEGCLVNGTLAGSPAYRAGLRSDDVIIRFQGDQFGGIKDLVHLIQSTRIGTPVRLTVIRDRQEMELAAVVGGPGSVEIPEPAPAQESEIWERMGVRVDYVAASERLRKGYQPSQPMVEISKVRPGSVAESRDLHPGLLIHRVDRLPTPTPKDFYEVVHSLGHQSRIVLTISKPGRRGYLSLQVPLK